MEFVLEEGLPNAHETTVKGDENAATHLILFTLCPYHVSHSYKLITTQSFTVLDTINRLRISDIKLLGTQAIYFGFSFN